MVEPTTGELVISIVGIQATLEKHAKYYFFRKHDDVKLLAEHQNVTLNEDTFKATVQYSRCLKIGCLVFKTNLLFGTWKTPIVKTDEDISYALLTVRSMNY